MPTKKICECFREEKQREGEECSRPCISFEFFPPKTEKGVENLMQRVERLHLHGEIFMDMTWGAGGSTSELTLELCKRMLKFGVNPNMHLTCTNMNHDLIDTAIDHCMEAGIKNIVALRGDPPQGSEEWVATDAKFTCALDLVKYIRERTGDYFCISVSGYPEGHVSTIKKVEDGRELSESEKGRAVEMEDGTYVCSDEDFEKELDYVVKKVEAGANIVITQMIFEVEVYKTFVAALRARGVTVPILPGLMCIQNEHGFTRMTQFCKSRVPSSLKKAILEAKDDKEALQKVSIDFTTTLCQQLEEFGIDCFHFYSLNLEKVLNAVLSNLELGHKEDKEEQDNTVVAQS